MTPEDRQLLRASRIGSGPARATATTRIACAPEGVFDTLADLRNETQWNARVSSAELRSDEPIGLGSRFGIVNGGASYDVTITTYDRPSRLVRGEREARSHDHLHVEADL
jgi:hypothetical protein